VGTHRGDEREPLLHENKAAQLHALSRVSILHSRGTSLEGTDRRELPALPEPRCVLTYKQVSILQDALGMF